MAFSNLPDDLWEDLLSLLPIKSATRFQSVNKSWRDLIRSPRFTAKLFHNFTLKNPHLLFKCVNLELHSKDIPGRYAKLDLPFINENFTMSYEGLRDLEILPVCANGVVCLYLPRTTIVLWNPTLKEYRDVPMPIVDPGPYCYHIGFGYDTKTSDYKVVKIFDSWNDKGPALPHVVEIYSLKESCWRKLDTYITDWFHYGYDKQFYLKGSYHWSTRSNGSEIILAFDMSQEVFFKMTLPYLCLPDKFEEKTFSVLHDSIAVIISHKDELRRCFEIWVMKEYGIEESWSKQIITFPLLMVDRPLGFAEDGEFILVDISGQLLLYDWRSEKTRVFNVQGFPRGFGYVNYKRGLVSLNN